MGEKSKYEFDMNEISKSIKELVKNRKTIN